jgi:hypothetical protein
MSNYSSLKLPPELERLARYVDTEYEDVNGTGRCMLSLTDHHPGAWASFNHRIFLDYRKMRLFAMHLMALADKAEEEFLSSHDMRPD